VTYDVRRSGEKIGIRYWVVTSSKVTANPIVSSAHHVSVCIRIQARHSQEWHTDPEDQNFPCDAAPSSFFLNPRPPLICPTLSTNINQLASTTSIGSFREVPTPSTGSIKRRVFAARPVLKLQGSAVPPHGTEDPTCVRGSVLCVYLPPFFRICIQFFSLLLNRFCIQFWYHAFIDSKCPCSTASLFPPHKVFFYHSIRIQQSRLLPRRNSQVKFFGVGFMFSLFNEILKSIFFRTKRWNSEVSRVTYLPPS
jgi:hypothetical protein